MESIRPIPDLVESSGEDDSEKDDGSDKVTGTFPWGLKRTKDYSQQVDMWLQLGESYRDAAAHSSLVMLMSPFLFAMPDALPAKWAEWSKTLEFFDVSGQACGNTRSIKEGQEYEQNLYVVRMLLLAHSSLAAMAKRRYDLIAVLDFIYQVDKYQNSDLMRVITVARGQEQMKKLCETVEKETTKQPLGPGLSVSKFDEWASSLERRVFTALLAGRQLAKTIHLITYEGRDVVEELKLKQTETGKLLRFKEIGNDFFKKKDFVKALDTYSDAIKEFPHSSTLHCNRCFTAMKLTQYNLAVLDGYRATCLSPKWGKAYHRRAESLKLAGKVTLAIESNRQGVKSCDNAQDKTDLKRQYIAIRQYKPGEETTKPTNEETQNKAASLPSEQDHTTDKKPEVSKADQRGKENKENAKPVEDIEKKEVKKPKSRKQKKPDENKKSDDKNRKNSDPQPTNDLSTAVTKESNRRVYRNYVEDASRAMIARRYHDAVINYDRGLYMIDDITDDKCVTLKAVEKFVLIYARGASSLETNQPHEISQSITFFKRIETTATNDKIYSHPMAFYGLARAHYLLNNFLSVFKPIKNGLQLMDRKSFRASLSWPGSDQVIPESNVKNLRTWMNELLLSAQNPPSPRAVCLNRQCTKESYRRNEIYISDIDFEGFIRIFCDWQCGISYHLKCWTRFRHEHFQKSGDKEVLGLPCLTDGCGGIVSQVTMFDENNEIKKNVQVPVAPREKIKAPIVEKNQRRTSKSKRNLQIRFQKIREAKAKQRDYRKSKETSYIVKNTSKLPKTVRRKEVTEEDIANATVLRRDTSENDIPKLVKSKNKIKLKRTSNIISLQDFLGGGKYMSYDQAERIIRRNNNSETPFQIPPEFSEEILQDFQELESTMTTEDQLMLQSVHSLFEDFFLRNGPTRIDDPKFEQETSELTIDVMMCIATNFDDFIVFLSSKHDTFLRTGPYIGLQSQKSTMDDLWMEHSGCYVPLAATASQPVNEEPSAFMKELQKIGDVSPENVQAILQDTNENTNGAFGELAFAASQAQSVAHANGTTANIVYTDLAGSFNKPAPNSASTIPTSTTVYEKKDTCETGSFVDSRLYEGSLEAKMDAYLSSSSASCSSENLRKNSFASTKGSTDGSLSDIISKSALVGAGDGKSGQWNPVSMGEETPSEPDTGSILTSSNRDSPNLTFRSQKSKKVQVCAQMMDSESQTDLIPSCDDKIFQLEEAKTLLESRLEDLTDEHTRLRGNYRTETSKLSKELVELKEECCRAKSEASSAKQSAETEVKKAVRDRATLLENVKTLKKQVYDSRSNEASLMTALEEKNKDCERQTNILQSHREMALREQTAKTEESQRLEKKLSEMTERAVWAELKTLQVQESFGTKTLLKAKSECERFANEFEQLSHQHSNNHVAKTSMIEASLRWKKNADDCDAKLERTRSMFAEQSLLIHRGKPLKDLVPVSVPTPPAPGPSLQQVQAMLNRSSHRLPGNSLPISFPSQSQHEPLPSKSTSLKNNHFSPFLITSQQSALPSDNGWPVQTNGRETLSPSFSAPSPGPISPPTSSSATSSQPKGSFERIMVQLAEIYPKMTRSELAQSIKEVRQRNNNSLTGLSLEDIVKQASGIINKKILSTRKPSAPVHSTLPSSSRSLASSTVAPWVNSKSGSTGPGMMLDVGDDEPCVICHDPLNSRETHRLLCGHIYHSECLNQWLTRNRTCPTCRDYAVDASEYPALKTIR